ncbi:MAG: hypothetical protein ACP5US_02235 [Candidatus Kryptoniota bacterium]
MLSLFLLWNSTVRIGLSQSNAATISVMASVVQSISVSTSGGADGQGNLDFGITVVNRNVTVNPNTNPAACIFTVNGAAGHTFTVTYSNPGVLLSDGQGNSLTFIPVLVGSSSSSSQGTAAPVSSGATLALNSTGAYYFWLGGSVYVPNGQQEGTYSGIFSLTATY